MATNKTKKKSAKKSTPSPRPMFNAGDIVLIRAAVYHALGRVVGVHSVGGVAFVQLSEASYLGDTGRFHEATRKRLSEVANAEIEPVGDGVLDVQIGIICDVSRAVATESAVK